MNNRGDNRRSQPRSQRSHNQNQYHKKKYVPNEVRGVIFMSDLDTFGECLEKQLFGTKGGQWPDIAQNVYKGIPLFLYNYKVQKLYGVFVAEERPQYNLVPSAWSTEQPYEGMESPYPSQVKVMLYEKCETSIDCQGICRALRLKTYQTKFNTFLTQREVKAVLQEFSKVNPQKEERLKQLYWECCNGPVQAESFMEQELAKSLGNQPPELHEQPLQTPPNNYAHQDTDLQQPECSQNAGRQPNRGQYQTIGDPHPSEYYDYKSYTTGSQQAGVGGDVHGSPGSSQNGTARQQNGYVNDNVNGQYVGHARWPREGPAPSNGGYWGSQPGPNQGTMPGQGPVARDVPQNEQAIGGQAGTSKEIVDDDQSCWSDDVNLTSNQVDAQARAGVDGGDVSKLDMEQECTLTGVGRWEGGEAHGGVGKSDGGTDESVDCVKYDVNQAPAGLATSQQEANTRLSADAGQIGQDNDEASKADLMKQYAETQVRGGTNSYADEGQFESVCQTPDTAQQRSLTETSASKSSRIDGTPDNSVDTPSTVRVEEQNASVGNGAKRGGSGGAQLWPELRSGFSKVELELCGQLEKLSGLLDCVSGRIDSVQSKVSVLQQSTQALQNNEWGAGQLQQSDERNVVLGK